MKRLLFALVIVLSLCSFGCGTGDTVTGPSAPDETLLKVGDPTADDRGAPSQTTKVLYTKDGTLICDYPNGFIGPIPPGHAREDGSI